MQLSRFLRPLARVVNQDAAIRFTLDDEELDISALEYDGAWYVRLKRKSEKKDA